MKLILFLLTLIAVQEACSPLPNNTLVLTTISDEVVRIKLSSIFTNSDYHNVTKFPVIDQFQIISPIEQVQSTNIPQPQELVASKYYKTSKTKLQFHNIALLLVNNGEYGISYNSKLSTSIPQVDQQINQISKPGSTCYDLVLLGDGFVVDCKNTDGDYFILMNPPLKSYIQIISTEFDQRRLDQMDNYIFRSTIDKLELYQYTVGQITLLKTLDQGTLRTLLNKPDFNFLIREFKTHTNGQFSILNWNGELLIFEYQNNDWILINCIYTNRASYSYDLDIEKNTYVILQDVKIYYKAITQQEFIIDFLGYDAKNKIFLTQDYIVLQEKQNLTLFSQFLTKMDILTVKETDQLLSTKQNGFLLASKDLITKYSLNQEHYLQAKVNNIEENYRWLTLQQIANPSCKVFIQFKAVYLNNTEVFYNQEPSSLITEGIFSKQQDITINNILQGPNLKYEFKNNDLLNITALQTISVTLSKVDPNANYRKAIYAPTIYNNVYIIQQDEIFRIITYSCETSSKTLLICQQMSTATTIPVMLKDTPNQYWWLNYDSLFLAVSNGSKLDIYYLNYKGQSFDILQNLQLEGDVKQISSDGQFLFVLVDITVHIYSISTLNKVKSIYSIIGADQIYSTQNKDGHLFMLFQNTLSLYFISEQQYTLIWQETIAFEKINVAIFYNQFVILTESIKDQYQAIVYNYQNEVNIYFEKQLSLYEYSYIELSTIQTNIVNNLLYVRGTSKWTLKDSILVYDISTQGQNALFISLEYSLNTQLTQAGNFLFLLDANRQANNFYITGQNFGHASVRQDYKQVDYTTIKSLTVRVANNENYFLYQQPFQLVNRGEHIFQTLDKLSLNLNNQTKCADLGQSWYSGQVQNLTMDNSSKFSFKNSLEKQNEVLNFSPFITNLDDNYLIQVMNNKVVLIKKEDLTEVEFPMDYNITNLLTVYNDLVFVEVTVVSTYYLHIIKCSEGLCHMLLDNQIYQQRLNKAFIDENFFFLTVGSTIKVYNYKENILNPQQYVLIQTITPIRYSPYTEIKHMYENVYHFYSIDLSGELLVALMYKLSATQSTNLFIGYDLRQMIQSQNIYTPDSMLPSGLFLIPNQDYLELLIVFSYSASISLKFTVDCSQGSFCDITPVKQTTVYQQYGTWYTFPMYNSAYVNEKILQRVFLNQNTLQYELFLYDIESSGVPKLTIASLESPEMLMPLEFYQIMSFVYQYKGQLHLLASVENKDRLNHYLLLRSPQLCTMEEGAEDDVKFQLKNKNEQLAVQLHVVISPYVPPAPIPDDSDTGHFPYWVIAPIILGVAALGFLAYKCYQKKNKVDDDRLLLA